jgi:hypothetical protein
MRGFQEALTFNSKGLTVLDSGCVRVHLVLHCIALEKRGGRERELCVRKFLLSLFIFNT